MPRKPTGNPRGRPKGSGHIGEDQVRFTVRIHGELYSRFVAFAEGRSFTRGAPQLAICVRDALAHYLACPHKRQTKNILLPHEDNNRQTEKSPEAESIPRGEAEDTHRQTRNVPALPVPPAEPQRESISLPGNEQRASQAVSTPAQVEPDENKRQTQNRRVPREQTALAAPSTPDVTPADDLDDMPQEPENGPAVLWRQPEKRATPVTVGPPSEAPPPVVPGPAFNLLVYWLQPPAPCGHVSHGAAGNLVKRSTGKCKLCEDAKAAQKKAAKRSAPGRKEDGRWHSLIG